MGSRVRAVPPGNHARSVQVIAADLLDEGSDFEVVKSLHLRGHEVGSRDPDLQDEVEFKLDNGAF